MKTLSALGPVRSWLRSSAEVAAQHAAYHCYLDSVNDLLCLQVHTLADVNVPRWRGRASANTVTEWQHSFLRAAHSYAPAFEAQYLRRVPLQRRTAARLLEPNKQELEGHTSALASALARHVQEDLGKVSGTTLTVDPHALSSSTYALYVRLLDSLLARPAAAWSAADLFNSVNTR